MYLYSRKLWAVLFDPKSVIKKKFKLGGLDAQCHRCTCMELNWRVFNLVIFTKFAKLLNQKKKKSKFLVIRYSMTFPPLKIHQYR